MKSGEVKKFTCPMTILAGNPSSCIGKDCAVWRWAEPKWGAIAERRGYCGLGGDQKFPLNPDNEQQR